MMSDRMIPVPESALRALAAYSKQYPGAVTDALLACLPEPEPTFTDEEALAFYRALLPDSTFTRADAISDGRFYLTRLAKAGWTAPKALCPPPSPALVEVVVEAARELFTPPYYGDLDRLAAAVAAYDEQEGTA